jgi:hypothetical protein
MSDIGFTKFSINLIGHLQKLGAGREGGREEKEICDF